MGLFIHLFVNTHTISARKWENTYDESLELLGNFPAQLFRFDSEGIDGHKRYLYTPQLIKGKGTQEEKWVVSGDMDSNKHAESFALPRYLEERYDSGDTKDVLWVNEDLLHYMDGNGIDLFGGKTQGYPYHLAILAVGILVESRFPGSAYVIGDIETEQVENMTAWCNSVLKKTVEKPVCCDAQRLYSRLDKLYPDSKQVIERFRAVSIDSESHILTSLLQFCNRDLVLNDIEERLGGYHSLNQFGAIDIIGQFLESMSDVKSLIEIVSRIIEGSGEEKSIEFNLESLLAVLVRHMITIEKDKRESIIQLADNMNRMGDINHVMGKSMMKLLGFNPSYFDYYIPREELLDIFSAFAEEKRANFEKIINESEQWCDKQSKEYEEVEDTILQEVKQTDELSHSIFAIEKNDQHLFNLRHDVMPLSVQERYILVSTINFRVTRQNSQIYYPFYLKKA